MSGNVTASSATIRRARMRLEHAEAIITGLSAAYGRIANLFKHTPSAKDEQATTVRRAWRRASA